MANVSTAPNIKPETKSNRATLPASSNAGRFWTIGALALIVLATTLVYSPIAFNFFVGDDFVHLTWLSQAVHNTELIWRNFHSSWLDGTTTRFYRPLISVFMVTDYLIWGVNGFGFRLTNLLFHLSSSILIYFVVSRSAQMERPSSALKTWGLAAALLFALYPLHPEAVSWITGRVDSIVTTFCLGSLWSYMCWRQSKKFLWCVSTMLFMWLGLFSKEMAITLPAIFLAYEALLVNQNSSGTISESSSGSILSKGINWLKPTLPFWLALVFYFGLRRIALGTFVGGYDDSLLFISDWRAFISGKVHALRMLLIPINKEVFGSHHWLTKMWTFAIVASTFFAGVAFVRRPQIRRAIIFNCAWLLFSLLPVYKIFAIADDLQGSRLGYVATVPLCILLTSAFALWLDQKNKGNVQTIICALAVLLFIPAGIICWANNQAWAQAGRESNAIRAALSDLYKQIEGDPQVLFIGLPDQKGGAYICRNSLWGMTKKPQLDRDIFNCQMVNSFEPILPFGYLKESIAASPDQIKIFRWSSTDSKFIAVSLASNSTKTSEDNLQWTGNKLAEIISPEMHPGSQAKSLWCADGALEAWSAAGAKGRAAMDIMLNGKPSWSCEFVAVTVEPLPSDKESASNGADLLLANDLNPDFDLARRAHSELITDAKTGVSKFIFALHSLPEWSLGGNCRDLKLLLPDNSHMLVTAVELISAEQLIPHLNFANSGYLGTKGFLHLSSKEKSQELLVDASKVAGANAAFLEITRPNLLFESQNSAEECKVIMKTIALDSPQGHVVLKREFFPATGIYEARVKAVDTNGHPVGLAGDHIVVSVED